MARSSPALALEEGHVADISGMLVSKIRVRPLALLFLGSVALTTLIPSSIAASSGNIIAPPPAGVHYRAAVVEAYPLLAPYTWWNGTAAGAVDIMLRNVALIDGWTHRAAERGAQIVVFPEDIVSSFGGRSGSAGLFSVQLPAQPPADLCTTLDPLSSVVRELSCIAKRHRVVIVVGLGINAPCSPRREPFTGRWMPCYRSRTGHYDGAAAFGPDGALLGSHRRTRLGFTWGKVAAALLSCLPCPSHCSLTFLTLPKLLPSSREQRRALDGSQGGEWWR